MFKLKSVKKKIGFGAGGCVLLTALIIIGFSGITMRINMLNAAMKDTLTITRGQAVTVENKLMEALYTARILAQNLSAIKDNRVLLDLDRDRVMDLLKMTMEANPDLIGVFTCWDPNGFDGMDVGYRGENGHDASGRFAPYVRLDEAGKAEIVPLMSMENRVQNETPGSWYDVPKSTSNEFIQDPYEILHQDKKTVITSITVPIIANQQFFGVVGVDMSLDFIQTITDTIDIYNGSGQMLVISNNGLIAGISKDRERITQHIKNVHPEDYEAELKLIKNNEERLEVHGKNVVIFSPVKLGRSNTPWSVNIFVPKENVVQGVTLAMVKMMGIGLACLAVALMVLWFIAGNIVRPVSRVVELAGALAEGDLTKRLNMNLQDEIGTMADALDHSAKNLSGIISQVTTYAESQANASQELSSVSSQLAAASEELSTQSESVAGSTEEMSASISSMASAAEEMNVNIQSLSSTSEEISQNMNSVAASIEQMSTSIENIATSAQNGSDISRKAMEMSDAATKAMDVLGKAAKEIDQVTSLIKRIANQTNLLALNATIEAASAGDAGRGFAVVAQEIKELALQCGQAANVIAGQIKGIQKNTTTAVDAIAETSHIIHMMNDSSTEILKSVEEQISTSTEISGSIQQTSVGASNIANAISELARGSNDVSKSALEGAQAVTEVSSNIQGISKAARETNSGAQQVKNSANDLALIASKLRGLAGGFKV